MNLRSYPEPVRVLVRAARARLREWLPHAKETRDPTAKMFAYTYGPGYRGVICTLILSKSGVKLGIAGGAHMPDPERLLRGAGKLHRYVQLKSPEDLLQQGVKELVVAAGDAREAKAEKLV